MSQFIIDDVDALIKEGHGDQDRLNRIKEEYKTKKLITIDDRKYVEGLMSRYMRPKVETAQQVPKAQEPKIVPPPPPPPPKPRDAFEVKHQKARQESIPRIRRGGKTRIMIISMATVVAVVAAGLVGLNQDGFTFPSIGPAPADPLQIDQESYARGDIISITGTTSTPANGVRLAITNPAGQEVWSETVKVRTEGRYSTLAIAGGDGWGQQGTYTITAAYGNTVDQIEFTFSPVVQE